MRSMDPALLGPTLRVGSAEDTASILKRAPGILVVHECLGDGTFGDVYRCTAEGIAEDVAVKVVLKGSGTTAREAEVHEKLQHPNLVKLLRVLDGELPMLVLQLCRGGTTERLVRGRDLGEVLLGPRIQAARDVISATEYLHLHRVVHRDIKSGNAFFESQVPVSPTDLPPVFLGDLGFARAVEPCMTNFVGTARYMAPEVAESNVYGLEADIFSFGMMLYELVTGQVPFQGMQSTRILAGILTGMRPPLEPVPEGACHTILRSVLSACWAENPEDRPTADFLAKHLQGLA